MPRWKRRGNILFSAASELRSPCSARFWSTWRRSRWWARARTGLAPLHAWLPDAHAEGPTPISAVLSGLLLNVALYALLRFKILLAANPGAIAPGPLMVTIGLVSVVFAAFMLYRRRDIKRLFAYSSIH